MLTVEPETWPLLAADTNWRMRQGLRHDQLLSNGSALTIEFVWSTTDGVTASCEVDGQPLMSEFDLDRARATQEVFAILTEVWKQVEA